MPPIVSVLGMVFLFGGLSTIGYGVRPPTESSSNKTIIIGYVFVTMGGIIGILIGAGLAKKENKEDKFHGKMILAIGIVSTVAFFLFYFLI